MAYGTVVFQEKQIPQQSVSHIFVLCCLSTTLTVSGNNKHNVLLPILIHYDWNWKDVRDLQQFRLLPHIDI